MNSYEPALTYSKYLAIEELLRLQKPLSDGPEHDELLFIIIHQTYELWFKQLLHEIQETQKALESGDTHYALALLGRIRTIMKICVSQIDILETMTPRQFNSFRSRLDSASGFQSAQFREFEVILGRRDSKVASHLDPSSREKVESRMSQNSLWDSTVKYLFTRGAQLSNEILNRNVQEGYQPSIEIQRALLDLHEHDPEAGLVFERLVDIDEGLQEWRYRHVKMVERTIGNKSGTGGSSGANYLKSTLFHPVFPDLWEIRSSF